MHAAGMPEYAAVLTGQKSWKGLPTRTLSLRLWSSLSSAWRT